VGPDAAGRAFVSRLSLVLVHCRRVQGSPSRISECALHVAFTHELSTLARHPAVDMRPALD
jgi:hypothetical protein